MAEQVEVEEKSFTVRNLKLTKGTSFISLNLIGIEAAGIMPRHEFVRNQIT
jgi:hypothetical protein